MTDDLDWNTLSLKTGNTISQRSLKEISVSTAVDLEDMPLLRTAAKGKDGLVGTRYRAKAWPLLQNSKLKTRSGASLGDLEPHRDEEQVRLDVNRSFVYYPLLITDKEKADLRTKLETILVMFLRNHPELSYYQGLHDVCSVILLNLQDPSLSYQFFESFALLHLRDFMMPNLDCSLETLKVIPELLQSIDPVLFKDLEISTVQPFFCLSPIITLFSHDLKTLPALGLIFDQVISYRSIVVIFYIYVILLINKKDLILEKIQDEDDCFSRVDRIHSSLSKFLEDINYDDINDAILELPETLRKYQCTKLKSLKELSPLSVLRTTSNLEREQELTDSFQQLLNLQIQESKKPKRLPPPSFLVKLINSSKTNKQLFKWTFTVGILSLVINLLLNGNRVPVFQTFNSFVPTTWNAGLGVSRGIKDYLNLG